jgi:hypothetical protein
MRTQAYYYICVLILIHMRPHNTSVLYLCPHNTMCPHNTTFVLIILCICPHNTIYVSSYHTRYHTIVYSVVYRKV